MFMHDQGVQMENIQALLDHSDLVTTQSRYAMFTRTDLHNKVSVLDNVIPIKRIG
jgi:site-specific recombinase XerD